MGPRGRPAPGDRLLRSSAEARPSKAPLVRRDLHGLIGSVPGVGRLVRPAAEKRGLPTPVALCDHGGGNGLDPGLGAGPPTATVDGHAAGASLRL